MNFSERLNAAMKKRGLDSVMLSGRLRERGLRIDPRTIQAWVDSDQRPSTVEAYDMLCASLSVSADWLISGKGKLQ